VKERYFKKKRQKKTIRTERTEKKKEGWTVVERGKESPDTRKEGLSFQQKGQGGGGMYMKRETMEKRKLGRCKGGQKRFLCRAIFNNS